MDARHPEYVRGYRDGLAAAAATRHAPPPALPATCTDCMAVNPDWAEPAKQTGARCPTHQAQRRKWRDRAYRRRTTHGPDTPAETYKPEPLPTPPEWVGARFLTQETLATLLDLSLRARDARARLAHTTARRDEPAADLARRDLNDLADHVLAVTLHE